MLSNNLDLTFCLDSLIFLLYGFFFFWVIFAFFCSAVMSMCENRLVSPIWKGENAMDAHIDNTLESQKDWLFQV